VVHSVDQPEERPTATGTVGIDIRSETSGEFGSSGIDIMKGG
jgi:hypothetical protein